MSGKKLIWVSEMIENHGKDLNKSFEQQNWHPIVPFYKENIHDLNVSERVHGYNGSIQACRR
jgi:hypothetical protein